MYSVYVLRSLKNGKRYVGYTTKLVADRLLDHYRHSNKWTRQNGPFKILHQESCADKAQAMMRERSLKSGQGRKWLDENLTE